MTCKLVISGYCCTGKTSVMELLQHEFGLQKPTCYTTRPMRRNEREGTPYSFITETVFAELARADKLFDPISHAGNHYAADREALFDNRNWVLDILPDSWEVYNKIPGVIGIYLIPPTEETIRARATARGDSPEAIDLRLKSIKQQDIRSYQYVIEPQESVQALFAKIRAIAERALSQARGIVD